MVSALSVPVRALSAGHIRQRGGGGDGGVKITNLWFIPTKKEGKGGREAERTGGFHGGESIRAEFPARHI